MAYCHSELIGPEKARHISLARSALDSLDHGVPITRHSDAPVVLPNLMQVVWATVNRVTRSGRVLGDPVRQSADHRYESGQPMVIAT